MAEECLRESVVQEGLVLANAMHIIAVKVNTKSKTTNYVVSCFSSVSDLKAISLAWPKISSGNRSLVDMEQV